MEVRKFCLPEGGKLSKALISAQTSAATDVEAGTAFLPKGTRVPASGVNAYPKHEISFVLEGCIEGEVNGTPCRFEAGDIVHMVPDEVQWGVAIEDTRIFYVFFGEEKAEEASV